jgi:integrase
LRNWQAPSRFACPAADLEPHHRDLLFLTGEGQRIHPSNFNRRIWRKARNTLPKDVQGVRFHDLRHTAVAVYLESGHQAGQPNNPKELQVRMGHSP